MADLQLTYDPFSPTWGSPYMQTMAWTLSWAFLFTFAVAFAMGSNDVANSFGTSVGSKTLTIFQACIMAGIMNFVGAVAFGSGVSATIAKGIVNGEVFEPAPHLYMVAMLCVMIGTFFLVIGATYFRLCVSTTHATVGAVIGVGIVQGAGSGSSGVTWGITRTAGGVGGIILSWFTAPLLAGLCSACFYLLSKWACLNRPLEEAKRNQNWVASIMVGFVSGMIIFFGIYDYHHAGTDIFATGKFPDFKLPGIIITPVLCLFCGAVISLLCRFFVIEWVFQKYVNSLGKKKAKQYYVEHQQQHETKIKDGDEKISSMSINVIVEDLENDVCSAEDEESVSELKEFELKKARQLHAEADVFSEEIEERFKVVQVFSACFMALTHGANDVGNVVGPFSGMIGSYTTATFTSTATVPVWSLAFSAIGIVAGLFLFGSRVMATLGHNLTKVTPSRGVNVEIGAAFASILATFIGCPVSTSQCAVGSVIAIGLCNTSGVKSVNWMETLKIFIGWAVTLPISGLVAAGLYVGFKKVTERQFPSDFFPINENSTAYGVHYPYGIN